MIVDFYRQRSEHFLQTAFTGQKKSSVHFVLLLLLMNAAPEAKRNVEQMEASKTKFILCLKPKSFS